MKGVMDFLERAGLIVEESSSAPASVEVDQIQPAVATAAEAPVALRAGATPLNLAEIYANEGVPSALYPAERLLRLIDGLSAMDEAVRLTAIKAMDEADESWTIADPVGDASAKLKALALHAQRLQLGLQQLEQETLARVEEVRVRQEQSVGAIRKQIADLEALASREIARAEKETSDYNATFSQAKEQTSRELDEIARTSAQLQNLVTRFGTSTVNE